jgi:hypothetical protein
MMVCVTNTMVFATAKIVFAGDTVFLEADTAFAVLEKTIGGAPAVVSHKQPTTRNCEKAGMGAKAPYYTGGPAMCGRQH